MLSCNKNKAVSIINTVDSKEIKKPIDTIAEKNNPFINRHLSNDSILLDDQLLLSSMRKTKQEPLNLFSMNFRS
jgi:hypothetical protein